MATLFLLVIYHALDDAHHFDRTIFFSTQTWSGVYQDNGTSRTSITPMLRLEILHCSILTKFTSKQRRIKIKKNSTNAKQHFSIYI